MGIQRAIPDAECVGYSEIDKYADAIYRYHFDHRGFGDATRIVSSEIPDFDLLVAGFPCQAFSIAGRRQGFDDARGTMFFEIARILRDKRPRHIMLENVRGLLSHESGKTFQRILGILADLGYVAEWQILNSKSCGIPQSRPRAFIVGATREESSPKVFPIEREGGEAYSKGEKGVIVWQAGYRTKGKIRQYEGEVPAISANAGMGGQNVPYVLHENMSGNITKHNIAQALRSGKSFNNRICDGLNVRRLTPVEFERLQGFPDGWTAKGITDGKEVDMSDTRRYKALGNAVTVNVIEFIAKRFGSSAMHKSF